MMMKNVALVTFKRPIDKPPNFNSPASQSSRPFFGFVERPLETTAMKVRHSLRRRWSKADTLDDRPVGLKSN
jgi:hypothetical protein